MTLKIISENQHLVLDLDLKPSNLRIANALIDQALMNFSYESMNDLDQKLALQMFGQMIHKFNEIRGR